MVRLFLISLLVSFFTSCKDRVNKNAEVDKFYTEKGELDSARIPFIKPYEAILLNKNEGWFMNLKGDKGDSGFNNIKKATVVDRTILLYSVNSIFNGMEAPQTWRIISPSQSIEIGFDNHQEYLNYLKKMGFTYEPSLHDIETIADYFDKYDLIDWKSIK